jgi:hypothetical protein
VWELHEYAAVTWDADARRAAHRTGELLLDHRHFRSLRTGRPMHSTWTKLHYPSYWHYDIRQALLMLSRMGLATDPRASDALGLLQSRQAARRNLGSRRRAGARTGFRAPPHGGRRLGRLRAERDPSMRCGASAPPAGSRAVPREAGPPGHVEPARRDRCLCNGSRCRVSGVAERR